MNERCRRLLTTGNVQGARGQLGHHRSLGWPVLPFLFSAHDSLCIVMTIQDRWEMTAPWGFLVRLFSAYLVKPKKLQENPSQVWPWPCFSRKGPGSSPSSPETFPWAGEQLGALPLNWD